MPIKNEHYPLMGAICASLFSTPLMMAGVNAVLPEIGTSFAASGTQLGLVGACYSLGLAIFQLTTGSLGDIAGHRFIFLSGSLVYGFSSFIAGFIQEMNIFLGLRFMQGMGGAMVSASGLALLASSSPPEERASYLGISGAAVYAGIACGPPVAGFITGSIGWKYLFWINALCCIAVFLIMKLMVSQDWRPAAKNSFDWPGAFFYAMSMAGLTLASACMANQPKLAWISVIAFIIFLALFVLREKRASFPILNLALLSRNLVLRLAAIEALVNYASIFGMLFYFSFYLQIVLDLDVQKTGLILSVQAIVQAIITPFGIRLCKLWQMKWVSAAGSALCGSGLIMAAFMTESSSIWILVAAQFLLGAGISLFSLANTAIILECGGKKAIGQTSALTGAMRTAGQLLSMIMVTLSIGWFLGSQAISHGTMAGFMHSMKSSLLIFGALNLAAIICVLAQNRHEPEKNSE